MIDLRLAYRSLAVAAYLDEETAPPSVGLHVENWSDPQESCLANLTPDEARRLAVTLNALADEVEEEQYGVQ